MNVEDIYEICYHYNELTDQEKQLSLFRPWFDEE